MEIEELAILNNPSVPWQPYTNVVLSLTSIYYSYQHQSPPILLLVSRFHHSGGMPSQPVSLQTQHRDKEHLQ